MALKLTKNDIQKVSGAVQTLESGGETDFIGGVNKLIGNLGSTIEKAVKLFEGYTMLRDKFKPQQQAQHPPRPMPAYQEPVKRPIPVQQPKKKENEVVEVPEENKIEEKPVEESSAVETKIEKAEKIFNKIHESLKPKFFIFKNITAKKLVEEAMKPENKKVIIETLAEML